MASNRAISVPSASTPSATASSGIGSPLTRAAQGASTPGLESPLPPQLAIKLNTAYEEIGCVGYEPQLERLEATINIKRQSGYGGDICSAGTPEFVRFYLGEKPILKNVDTWRCREADDLKYVLDHLDELVVKEVQGSGGYGMLIGPAATPEELEAFRARVQANPANYIAQPTLSLSTCPTFVAQGIAPRHVDLRPYVLSGREVKLVPGGLTRVALEPGSLVVNSSQGGGTKDTWVVD